MALTSTPAYMTVVSIQIHHHQPGGGHSVGLAFDDADLIARLIEHLKLNNIHEVPAFYGTSSTID